VEFDLGPVVDRIPLLLEGLGLTLGLTALAFVAGGLLGLPLALSRMLPNRWLRLPVTMLVESTLSTPVPLHLFLVFFGLTAAFGILISPFHSILLVLVWNQAVVMSENYRSGLQSVPKGIRAAASVLGLPTIDRYRYVILPLAIRAILPPTTSSTVNLIKDSALAGFIGANDLLNAGRLGATESFRPIEFYTVVAIMYFVISYPIVWFSDRVEHKMSRSRAA
jgi:polar amino acid transport system permease protein